MVESIKLRNSPLAAKRWFCVCFFWTPLTEYTNARPNEAFYVGAVPDGFTPMGEFGCCEGDAVGSARSPSLLPLPLNLLTSLND